MTELPSHSCAQVIRQPISSARLSRAKPAYTTRFVARALEANEHYSLLSGDGVVPRSGDVVLACVEEIGQHARIELPDGRRARLLIGDEVLVSYGNRYAPDQFEAEVPVGLDRTNLVAAGGVAGDVVSCHDAMLPATTLRPLGLLADRVDVVNLARFAPFGLHGGLPRADRASVYTLAVAGTSMNAGKTTTVASIVRGLVRSGLDVCAGKVTGTGAGGDPGFYVDAGASRVLDFTDFGYPSTYRLPLDEIRGLFAALHAELISRCPDVVVLEVADGLLQQETAQLVESAVFAASVDAMVFAAADAMAAEAGVQRLRALGRHVSAVSGVLTRSPMTVAEARATLDVPVLTPDDLQGAQVASALIENGGSELPESSSGEIRVAV